MAFTDNLRHMRLGQFLSQAELARRSGLHALTITRLDAVIHDAAAAVVNRLPCGVAASEPRTRLLCTPRIPHVAGGTSDRRESEYGAAHVERKHLLSGQAPVEHRQQHGFGTATCRRD